MSNFRYVSLMNAAFGNRQGNPQDIDLDRVRSQSKRIGHEFCELMVALGADADQVKALVSAIDAMNFTGSFNLEQTRDSLCDIHVFAYGDHHLMGIDADRDMKAILEALCPFVWNTTSHLKVTARA